MFRSGASPCLRKLPLHSASHGQQVPEMVETWVMNDAYPLVNIQKAIEAMAIEIVDLAIKHRDFPVRKLLVYQRVMVDSSKKIMGLSNGSGEYWDNFMG